MSAAADNINAQIDLYVGNVGLSAFQNLNLNRILHLITALADANSGASVDSSDIIAMTSANFIVPSGGSAATDCPIPSLAGESIKVVWGEQFKFLEQDNGEIQTLTGGGFRVLIPGFDASKGNYHFYVFKEN